MEEKDVRTALGEVFSQCWESEEFKQHFKEDPKSVFEEYGVPYEDYIVIPASPEELTPEELEMINGGCGFLGVILVAGFVIVAGAVVFMGAAAVSAAAAAVVAESVGAVHAAIGVTVTVAS